MSIEQEKICAKLLTVPDKPGVYYQNSITAFLNSLRPFIYKHKKALKPH